MKSVKSYIQLKEIRFNDGSEPCVSEPSTYIRTTQNIIDDCVEHYRAALKDGIKPQVARGIIPQCAYTLAWCAFQPAQMKNFFKMRCDSHAQWEIQQFAYKMKESVEAGFIEIKLTPEREAELYARLESYQKNGVADLISKEEMIALLKEAEDADKDENNVCENCANGEPCNKCNEKIHCNVWDKSYLKNHTCDEYK
jgi:thymidylate synthase ThyX